MRAPARRATGSFGPQADDDLTVDLESSRSMATLAFLILAGHQWGNLLHPAEGSRSMLYTHDID
jgi:hypothetical protein